MRSACAVFGLALSLAVPVTAAKGATLNVQVISGTEVAVYTAASGEVNHFGQKPYNHATGYAWGFWEYVASVTLGSGCITGNPILCGPHMFADAEVHLGDEDDVSSISGSAKVAMYGDAGDDDIYNSNNTPRVDGGDDDDILRLSSNGTGTANGDAGDDQIGGGANDGNDVFSGGDGSDLVTSRSPYGSTLSGNDGDDVLTVAGGSANVLGTVNGGAGNDVLTYVNRTVGGKLAFIGGGGEDLIVGPAKTVDAGDDDDEIDVQGGSAASTVTCGAGTDTVYADASDVVAGDCETVIVGTPAPSYTEVSDALSRTATLNAHVTDPSV
jgi:hypothetical protein